MTKKLGAILLALALVLTLGLTPAVAMASNPPNWDVSGCWLLDFAGGTENREFADLVQDSDGNVSGHFYWHTGEDWEYGGTLDGHVSGDDLYLYYDRDPIDYTGWFDGTITKYGMSGTFEASTGFECTWSTVGSPRLLWEARIAGGGQILAESDEWHRNGRNINWQISFGLGAYIVNGEYWLDDCEVTFHHVSDPDIVKGKFVATALTEMNFFGDGSVANFRVVGEFNETSGYSMIIRLQDAGEPGCQDNVRFELYHEGTKVYDSLSDFPGESSDFGSNRNLLDRGNLQVEDSR